jgi:Methyltransferase domain
MVFGRILKHALTARRDATVQADDDARRVLNVGGSNKDIPIPECYNGWDHLLLDIDPRGKPDIVCDARKLQSLKGGQFDAVYCSHNLEHYYKHDCPDVLAGFLHVLKSDGFADIRVPDMMALMKRVSENNLDIEDVLYVIPAGPITVRDVIYGWSKEIERSGEDFYAHKSGFSDRSLSSALKQAGFGQVFPYVAPDKFELRAIAFKTEASEAHWHLLGLPH